LKGKGELSSRKRVSPQKKFKIIAQGMIKVSWKETKSSGKKCGCRPGRGWDVILRLAGYVKSISSNLWAAGFGGGERKRGGKV